MARKSDVVRYLRIPIDERTADAMDRVISQSFLKDVSPKRRARYLAHYFCEAIFAMEDRVDGQGPQATIWPARLEYVGRFCRRHERVDAERMIDAVLERAARSAASMQEERR